MAEVHNLDDVQEYFEFKIKEHTYRFRHLTTEEMKALENVQGPEQNTFFFKFITKVDESAPDFEEVTKQMTIPHWKKFREMIASEFGA